MRHLQDYLQEKTYGLLVVKIILFIFQILRKQNDYEKEIFYPYYVGWPKGIYVVKVTIGKEELTEKIMVK